MKSLQESIQDLNSQSTITEKLLELVNAVTQSTAKETDSSDSNAERINTLIAEITQQVPKDWMNGKTVDVSQQDVTFIETLLQITYSIDKINNEIQAIKSTTDQTTTEKSLTLIENAINGAENQLKLDQLPASSQQELTTNISQLIPTVHTQDTLRQYLEKAKKLILTIDSHQGQTSTSPIAATRQMLANMLGLEKNLLVEPAAATDRPLMQELLYTRLSCQSKLLPRMIKLGDESFQLIQRACHKIYSANGNPLTDLFSKDLGIALLTELTQHLKTDLKTTTKVINDNCLITANQLNRVIEVVLHNRDNHATLQYIQSINANSNPTETYLELLKLYVDLFNTVRTDPFLSFNLQPKPRLNRQVLDTLIPEKALAIMQANAAAEHKAILTNTDLHQHWRGELKRNPVAVFAKWEKLIKASSAYDTLSEEKQIQFINEKADQLVTAVFEGQETQQTLILKQQLQAEKEPQKKIKLRTTLTMAKLDIVKTQRHDAKTQLKTTLHNLSLQEDNSMQKLRTALTEFTPEENNSYFRWKCSRLNAFIQSELAMLPAVEQQPVAQLK